MGFWIFMLVMALLLPAVMTAVGAYYRSRPPGRINAFVGYRTARSMKNEKTWAFAHRLFGRIWFRAGLAALPVSAAFMLLFLGQSEDAVGLAGSGLVLAQLALVIAAIFPVERALKRNFDESGNPLPGADAE